MNLRKKHLFFPQCRIDRLALKIQLRQFYRGEQEIHLFVYRYNWLYRDIIVDIHICGAIIPVSIN